MKERNVERKRAKKRAREKVIRKKELHANICTFLVKWHLRTTREPENEYGRMLSYGFRGFDNMRSRELIKSFEFVYSVIRDPEKYDEIMSALEGSWGRRHNTGVPLYKEKNQRVVLEEITLDSESLMGRLMELAFDLDVAE